MLIKLDDGDYVNINKIVMLQHGHAAGDAQPVSWMICFSPEDYIHITDADKDRIVAAMEANNEQH